MSWFSKLFSLKSREVAIRDNIAETKAAINRLETFAIELEKSDVFIKEHEKLFTMAANAIDYPFWCKDINGKFLFCNAACAEQLLRTTPDAALLLTDADFENNALARVCAETDRIVIETGKTHRTIEHAMSVGGDMWVDTTKSPFVMHGEIIGTAGMGKIITDQVSDDVRKKYSDPGWVEISVDLMFDPADIEKLMKNGNEG